MSSQTALILGVSGQTGAYLADILLSKGYIVHGVSRDSEANEFRNLRRLGIKDKIELHSASPTDFRNMLALLHRVAPDEIYNLAGQSSVALSFEQPLETFESVTLGTLTILECLRAYGRHTRFFQATSSDCFGNSQSPAHEDTPFRPRSPYAIAKAASHWAVAGYRETYDLHACCGILSNHESPLRPARFVTHKIIRGALDIAAGKSDKLQLGALNIERDWGWAPEYAQAIWQIVQRDIPSDYVIATGVTCSLRTFVTAAFEGVGLKAEDHVAFNPMLCRAGEVLRVALNPSKAERELSWRARIKMPQLVDVLLQCEREGSPGNGIRW